MLQSGRHRHDGFTLVELLIVIFIVGMLMALLLSALQSAREAGRRTQCLHKIGQLANAVQQFEGAYQQYPGWQHHPFPAIDARTAKPFSYSTSWFPQLLPYLGHEYLFDRTIPLTWRRPMRRGRDTFSYAPVLHGVAVCPSDVEKLQQKNALLSYAVNCGRKDEMPTKTIPADWRANGMFHDYWNWRGNPNSSVATVKMDSSFIIGGDGMANTLMIAENRDATLYYDRNETTNGFVFDPRPLGAGFKAINGPGFDSGPLGDYQKARPSSHHPGGVNAAFASGAARFLKEDMDYLVYIALMTTKGKEAREPGKPPSMSDSYSDQRIRNQPTISPDDL